MQPLNTVLDQDGADGKQKNSSVLEQNICLFCSFYSGSFCIAEKLHINLGRKCATPG